MPGCIKRRSRPRRHRLVDKKYLSWLHTLPCAIAGHEGHVCLGALTVHHVRRLGESKNDRRAIPLCQGAHLHDFGKYSIERLGKGKWEARYGVSLELLILGYQQRWEVEEAA
jgi:hypothetical protein